MNEYFTLTLALGAGVLLGAVFFGGLWWTVRQGVSSTSPAPWFLGSSILRIAIVVAGFSFVSSGHWVRLLACLLGFMIARFVVIRVTRLPVEHQRSRPNEASHAP